MAENDLKVIQKAKELATHTLKVTSNANRYPKKYRFSLVDKMQNKSMEIYEMLFEANRTDIKNYKRDRLEMQTKAITYCDELLFYIEMSYELNIISEKSVEYWTNSMKRFLRLMTVLRITTSYLSMQYMTYRERHRTEKCWKMHLRKYTISFFVASAQ